MYDQIRMLALMGCAKVAADVDRPARNRAEFLQELQDDGTLGFNLSRKLYRRFAPERKEHLANVNAERNKGTRTGTALRSVARQYPGALKETAQDVYQNRIASPVRSLAGRLDNYIAGRILGTIAPPLRSLYDRLYNPIAGRISGTPSTPKATPQRVPWVPNPLSPRAYPPLTPRATPPSTPKATPQRIPRVPNPLPPRPDSVLKANPAPVNPGKPANPVPPMQKPQHPFGPLYERLRGTV